MDTFETLYFKLFNSMTDAISAIKAMDFGKAKDILIHAQQETEALYVNNDL